MRWTTASPTACCGWPGGASCSGGWRCSSATPRSRWGRRRKSRRPSTPRNCSSSLTSRPQTRCLGCAALAIATVLVGWRPAAPGLGEVRTGFVVHRSGDSEARHLADETALGITVCHLPPGNIQVEQDRAPAVLAHLDELARATREP